MAEKPELMLTWPSRSPWTSAAYRQQHCEAAKLPCGSSGRAALPKIDLLAVRLADVDERCKGVCAERFK
jgi:hypothetical protein